MNNCIDLRSDTVTKPSPAMRKAMYEAEVGDDVYGDDPTVNRLQEKAAERLGKAAGLIVTSGTQGNLVAVLAQAQRGDEIIVGDTCHIFNNEAGGVSVLGSVVMYPIKTDRHGVLAPELIHGAVKPRDYHKPTTKLLCIENTHNNAGGKVIDSASMKMMADAGRAYGLRVHLDGARLFNAAIALGVDVSELTAPVDTATFCLSKGLACPIGSVLVGDADFIEAAARWRKILGGGMRQVGIIAAAGIVALDSMVDRMAEDFENAKKLAFGIAELDGIVLDPSEIETNIVRFGVPKGKGNEIATRLKQQGVYINGGDSQLRMVTHYGVDSKDIDLTLLAMKKVMSQIIE